MSPIVLLGRDKSGPAPRVARDLDPPILHGGRSGHETLDGFFETDLDIESAVGDKPLYILLLGYRKFFDFIIQEIIWGLAKWQGIPHGNRKTVKEFLHRAYERIQI